MIRICLAALISLTAVACTAETRLPPNPECRCRFSLGDTEYDLPCGTTFCADTVPAVCSPRGAGRQLEGTCDPDLRDTAILGLCEEDVDDTGCGALSAYDCEEPADFSHCTPARSPEDCAELSGCRWRNAHCLDQEEGCSARKLTDEI